MFSFSERFISHITFSVDRFLSFQEQEKIINEILDTPLSERSISDIFNLGSSRGFHAPETPDSSTLGTTGRRRLESGMDFCLDENNNELMGGSRAPGSPLGRSTPVTGTRLQRLNPVSANSFWILLLLFFSHSNRVDVPWYHPPVLIHTQISLLAVLFQ